MTEQERSDNQKHFCHLCHSQDYSLLYDRGRDNKTVYNYICDRCGFIFVLPRPDKKKLKAVYEQSEFSIQARKLVTPDEKKFRQCERAARTRLQLLESKLGNKLWSSGTVLEIGCGTGSFLRLMRGCGWDVLGLEPDAVYAQASQERYGIPIENVFVEEFSTDQKFDLVGSFQVIEHIADPNRFLASIHRLLVEEGTLYLECPSIDYWYGNADKFFWDVHINTFSRNTLLAFLAKNGFQTEFSGWTSNSIWAIAKKTQVKTKMPTDNPQRLRQLVELATATNSRLPMQRVNKARLELSRNWNIVKYNPAEAASEIWQQIRWQAPNLSYKSASASQVAVKSAGKAQLKIAHVGLHYNGNAGDTLLFPSVRWLLQKQVASAQFTLLPLHEKVTQATIDRINQHDALLIGGGGVLLADTNPNNASGWQWACPVELLEQIKVPVIVFAIGYNRFRGQQEFAPIFQKSISTLIEKSIFFGLRNRGSIEALKRYLPEKYHSKISFQPCPTTLLRHFYPNLPTREEQPTLAVNIAFDRHRLRFGKQEDEILWGIAEALVLLQQQGWEIKLFTHTKEDKDAHYWFRARGLFVEEVALWGVSPAVVLKEYSQVTLAVGMRGHAQMVPFGLGCPILSLISHDKLRFFLEDIGHPEWGLDVKTPNLRDRLVEKIEELTESKDSLQMNLLHAQEQLWKSTQENTQLIQSVLL